MSRGYTIHASVNGPFSKHTVLHKILNKHGQWCSATAEAMTFDTCNAAQRWFFEASDKVPLVGSGIWIEGPRGGFHYMRRS